MNLWCFIYWIGYGGFAREEEHVEHQVPELKGFGHFSTGVFPFCHAMESDAVIVWNSWKQEKLHLLHRVTAPDRRVSPGWKAHCPCLTQLTQFPQCSGAHWIDRTIIQPIQIHLYLLYLLCLLYLSYLLNLLYLRSSQ